MNSSHSGDTGHGAANPGRSSFFSVLVVSGLLLFSARAWTDDGPSRVVNILHDKLMEVMRHADSQDYASRYKVLAPVISAHFDTPLIARVILSRYWDTLNAEQKTQFIDLFSRLSIATYAARFDGYNGEKFVELSGEKLKRSRFLVKTELQRVDRAAVQLDYLMHQKDGNWYIISVIANGVNDLSLKRAEYASVIKNKGYDALIADITAKIRDMENPSNG